jgi:hypothetical protein
MKPAVQLAFLLLAASAVFAQESGAAAQIRDVHISRAGDNVQIEVSLSGAVNPKVLTATDPDRLVLELPGTVARARQLHISVNHEGIKQVRIGLNQADPPVTWVVIDLIGPRHYGLTANNNKITLSVLPAQGATTERHGGAKPAASGPLISRLWRRQKSPSQKSAAHTLLSNQTAAKNNLRTSFRVKYVAEGAAYLDGGRSAGLSKGMKLVVRDAPPASGQAAASSEEGPVVAELQVVSVAEISAVTEIHSSRRDVKPGDWAYLSTEDSATIAAARSANTIGSNSAMPLTEGEPRKAKLRASPSPDDSRIRARIGLDYSGIRSSGSTLGSSSTVGLAVQTDMTHIAGTYWNLQGYWRDRFTKNSQPDEATIEDYLDRTYTIQLYYDNPNSKWVAGFGRLYLPWAVSLDTIDGGYVGRKLRKGITAGVFGGSTPDPASWHYQPDQQMAGSFVNFEGGSYDDLHYSSTTGVALSMLKWQLDRPYVFFENEASYKQIFSVYHSFIIESPQGLTTNGITPGTGISRSYLTFHIQPHPRIGFDIYHNYFRDVPTAATALIGTGLVDKLLYQGISAGVRVEPVRNFTVYTTIGQSNKTGDARRSLNQMYGITWNEILHTGIRADLHYSKFDSSFARGEYRVLTLSRQLTDRMLWQVQAGSQSLASSWTVNNSSKFLDTSFDTNFGRHTFLQSGYTFERGAQLNYDQWYLSLGYRFDVKGPTR